MIRVDDMGSGGGSHFLHRGNQGVSCIDVLGGGGSICGIEGKREGKRGQGETGTATIISIQIQGGACP